MNIEGTRYKTRARARTRVRVLASMFRWTDSRQCASGSKIEGSKREEGDEEDEEEEEEENDDD